MNSSGSVVTFNELLERDGYDPAEVVVFRHKPSEPKLNKAFDWIVAERRDLFDCYQSTHGAKTEAALKRARFLASFIRYKPKQALFIGLYQIEGQQTLTVEGYQQRPLHRELMKIGMGGHKASDGRNAVIEFAMTDTGWHHDWSQRLIVEWPGLERSWYRWGNRNNFPLRAIAEEDLLAAPVPAWDQLTIDWEELSVIPRAWRSALAQWRGIYAIVDRSDGKIYVGSASGADNILQRWEDYARTGHGGNKYLRKREPTNFTFAILQRVSPDLPMAEVVEIERSWKERLQSQWPLGLNDN